MATQITPTYKPWDRSCTRALHLTQAGMTQPAISEIVEYVDGRAISTLLVSGAKNPYDTVGSRTKTKIGTIPEGKKIHSSGYRFRKMGRIQVNSIINGSAAVGTPTANGQFALSLRDNYIVIGMIVQFYNRSFQARVQSISGTEGAYIYQFQSVDGTKFDWTTMVAPQSGEKTAFGFFTAYGEASTKGYSRAHFPEEYIEHMTIQRKSLGLTGDALTEVVWFDFGVAKGWKFAKHHQAKLQYARENEWQRWISRSSMIDSSTGAYLTRSNVRDEKGDDVIIGNGIIPQIEGGNEMIGSGADGYATLDDFFDMMSTLALKSHGEDQGKHWYCVTGDSGYSNAQRVLLDYWNTMNGQTTVVQSNQVGGAEVSVGFLFHTLNFEGNSLTFVKHPLFSDPHAWSAKGTDGKTLQSGMYIFLNTDSYEGRKNVEILTKGNDQINRSYVEYMANGMTGYNGMDVTSSTDAMESHWLKQDMIVIYNTDACGIIHRRAQVW